MVAEVRAAIEADADRIELRSGDMGVLERAGEPRSVLRALVRRWQPWCGTWDGEPAVIFGAVPTGGLLGMTAYVFMVTSPLALAHPVALARRARPYVAGLQSDGVTTLFTTAPDEVAERWLRWLGFRPDAVDERGQRLYLRVAGGDRGL